MLLWLKKVSVWHFRFTGENKHLWCKILIILRLKVMLFNMVKNVRCIREGGGFLQTCTYGLLSYTFHLFANVDTILLPEKIFLSFADFVNVSHVYSQLTYTHGYIHKQNTTCFCFLGYTAYSTKRVEINVTLKRMFLQWKCTSLECKCSTPDSLNHSWIHFNSNGKHHFQFNCGVFKLQIMYVLFESVNFHTSFIFTLLCAVGSNCKNRKTAYCVSQKKWAPKNMSS